MHMEHCEHTEWISKMSQRKETTLNQVFKQEKKKVIRIDSEVSDSAGALF